MLFAGISTNQYVSDECVVAHCGSIETSLTLRACSCRYRIWSAMTVSLLQALARVNSSAWQKDINKQVMMRFQATLLSFWYSPQSHPVKLFWGGSLTSTQNSTMHILNGWWEYHMCSPTTHTTKPIHNPN